MSQTSATKPVTGIESRAAATTRRVPVPTAILVDIEEPDQTTGTSLNALNPLPRADATGLQDLVVVEKAPLKDTAVPVENGDRGLSHSAFWPFGETSDPHVQHHTASLFDSAMEPVRNPLAEYAATFFDVAAKSFAEEDPVLPSNTNVPMVNVSYFYSLDASEVNVRLLEGPRRGSYTPAIAGKPPAVQTARRNLLGWVTPLTFYN